MVLLFDIAIDRPETLGRYFYTEVLVFWQVHIAFGRYVEGEERGGEGRGGERVRSLGLLN